MKMKGDIYKDLIVPATHGIKSNDRKKNVRIPLDMMERNIRKIADTTRTDDPFNEVRKGNVIRRRKVAIA
jgi:hypothetical protein